MKLTYLGTAAAEGFPAIFCNCRYCNEARALGGKNIRTRSQSLVNDDLLIDFPPDTYSHFLNNGIEGDKIKYLLLTHGHSDHFYTEDMYMRSGAFAHDMRSEVLEVFCSRKTYEKIGNVPENIKFNIIKAFETVKVGSYRITALPARHMPGGEPLFYIIEGDKTLLYSHDTGYFFDEIFDYIKENKISFDMISFDCTNIDIPITDDGSHMGFPNIARVIERLKSIDVIKDTTVKYVNHFSHNGNPIQSVLEEKASVLGCGVSFDGCCVEF